MVREVLPIRQLKPLPPHTPQGKAGQAGSIEFTGTLGFEGPQRAPWEPRVPWKIGSVDGESLLTFIAPPCRLKKTVVSVARPTNTSATHTQGKAGQAGSLGFTGPLGFEGPQGPTGYSGASGRPGPYGLVRNPTPKSPS